MADNEKLIKLIRSTFDIYGLVINRKLCVTVANYLKKNPHEDPDKWMAQTIEHLLTQNLPTPHVTLDNLKIALTESVKPESTLKQTETVFNVIDAFRVPKAVYDLNKKKYVMKTMDIDLFPDAKYKSLVFKERLDLLWHRTLKHPHFASSKFGKTKERKAQLVPIEYLLSEAKTDDVYIMGVLAQLTEGHYYLEDYDASVKISLKDTCFNSSLIVEGSIVLAKGKYYDGIFCVATIDFPPPELSIHSRAYFGSINTFGGEHPTSLKDSEKLKAHEDTNKDLLIFISDFWVDNENVLKRFKILLSGFSDLPPAAIVLCGHFLSSFSSVSSIKTLKEGLKKLARIIAEFPLIQQTTKFVFVPGPYDFCAPKILPRAPLPKSIMEDFIKLIPGTYLATNPCRIQYCTKEIVVFRENMLSKLCRNTLHYPKSENDGDRSNKAQEIFKALTESIVRQSNLTPLLFSMIPVYWKHDQAMQLHPLPDIVIVADEFQPCKDTYFDCKVVNPGPFVKSNFSFTTYSPFDNEIDECDVPEEKS